MLLAAAAAMAGEITLQSPTEGAFLGKRNQIRFLITGARRAVTVRAVLTGPGGTTTINSSPLTPDPEGRISSSLEYNPADTTPVGDYTLTLSATEPDNTYEPQTVAVKVDVKAPRFATFTPGFSQFVNKIVRIRASIVEENVKDWRVQVNGQDIPGNTGSGNNILLDWDATLVERDGAQAVTFVVRDEANNETTQSVNVYLDRIRPTVSIATPRADTRIVPNTDINVAIDITDALQTSVDGSGVDVVMRTLTGEYIGRVPRTTITAIGERSIRWMGRIRQRNFRLPREFRLVVTVVDRAGNASTPQEVTVRIRR